ncbi:hypothetical protein AB0C31_52545, partial [Actinoplanes philippinensis]
QAVAEVRDAGPAEALTRLDEALTWWRGPAYAGARPPEQTNRNAPGSRFPRTGGRNAVEVMTAYLNLGERAQPLKRAGGG